MQLHNIRRSLIAPERALGIAVPRSRACRGGNKLGSARAAVHNGAWWSAVWGIPPVARARDRGDGRRFCFVSEPRRHYEHRLRLRSKRARKGTHWNDRKLSNTRACANGAGS